MQLPLHKSSVSQVKYSSAQIGNFIWVQICDILPKMVHYWNVLAKKVHCSDILAKKVWQSSGAFVDTNMGEIIIFAI